MPNAIGIEIDSAPIINVTKTANKSFVQIGETVTYTVVITNTGQVDIDNVIVTDIIQSGAVLVPNSLTVNGVLIEDADVNVGVNIGSIPSGGAAVVTYTVAIDDNPELCETLLSNQVTLDYEYGCTSQKETQNSNTVDVSIRCVELEVVKSVDTDLALVGDTITFTIKITNTGSVTLDNMTFTDPIPDNTVFVEDSVKINGVPQPGANPETGISLGTMNPGESVTVSFSVVLVKISCPASIVNKAYVSYEYQFGATQTVETGISESNVVVVPVAPTTFKQLSKDEVVSIPTQKPDMEEILNTLVDIEIVNTKIITTIKGTSKEGQVLTGYKLIIEGRINQKIEYVACKPQQSVHSAHFRVPFSSYIILPEDFVEGTEIQVEADVEDVYAKIINCRTLFKNITFMLFVKQKR